MFLRIYVSLLILLVLVVTSTGCSTSQNDNDSTQAPAQAIAVPRAITTTKFPADGTLAAFLIIDNKTRLPMKIEGSNATVTVNDISNGLHSIVVEYVYSSPTVNEIVVSHSLAKSIDVETGNNKLILSQSDYEFPDDDNDTYTNLLEVEDRTNPRDSSSNRGNQPIVTINAIINTIVYANLPNSGQLSVKLSVDSNVSVSKILDSNEANHVMSGLTTGSHQFDVEFIFTSNSFGEVSLATASLPAYIVTLGNNDINLTDADFTFTNSDTDQFSNLAEIEAGSSPFDPADYPGVDVVPPIVSNASLSLVYQSPNYVLSWIAATDVVSTNLQYQVYNATSNNIDTLDNIRTNGQAYGTWTSNNAVTISDITSMDQLYWNVIVKDEAGNENMYQTASPIIIDTIPPAVPEPTLSLVYKAPNYYLSWTAATDAVSTTLQYRVYNSTSNNINTLNEIATNGTAFGASTTSNSVTISGLTNMDQLYWNVVVNDEAGNENLYQTTPPIIIDITPPAVPDTSLTLAFKSPDYSLSWTAATDAVSTNLQYQAFHSTSDNINTLNDIVTNGTAFGTLTTNNSVTISGLANMDQLYWNVVVKDEAGNENFYRSAAPLVAIDNKFGGGLGYVTYNDAAGGAYQDGSHDLAMDSQGRIYVAGYSTTAVSSSSRAMVLWRYTAAGVLDTTFNNGGIITRYAASGFNAATGVIVDGQDRVLVTGHYDDPVTTNTNVHMFVWRFDQLGNPDTTFNNSGNTTFNSIDTGIEKAQGYNIDIDNTGNIIIGGGILGADFWDGVNVWRYTTNGVLDTVDFNNPTGYVYNRGTGDTRAIAIDSTNRVIAARRSAKAGDPAIMWRYDAVTNLQTIFNSDGAPIKWINDVAIDSLGRILVSGTSTTQSTTIDDSIIIRYTAAGALDTTFNNGQGYVTFPHPNGTFANTYMDFDSKDRIVAVGSARDTTKVSVELVIWRYSPEGVLDNSFNGGTGVYMYSRPGAAHVSNTGVLVDANDRIVVPGNSDFGLTQDMSVWRFIAP